VPPDAVALAVPLLLPHAAGVEDVPALSADGSVMLAVLVAVHPFASVIVQVYVPAESPVAVAAVPPDGDHE